MITFSENQQKIVNTLEAINRTHWIDNHNGTFSCSYCHTWVYNDDRFSYMRYCPYCGKKMDENKSNEEMEVEFVTCKNCKHRPVDDRGSIEPPYDVENRRLDETCPCINKADWHYSYVPEDEFFCAYVEKKSVTPVHKKSKWIFTKTILDKYGSTVECPSCHKKWTTYDEIRFEKETKYCPNCGEKMEAE